MAYDRTTGLTYLNGQFAALAADAGVAATDTDDGWKGVLDRTFKLPITDDISQEALLDMFALTLLARALAVRTQVQKTMGGNAVMKQRQQAFAQVKVLLDDAKELVKELGLLRQNQWQSGSFEMDFIEPRNSTWW